MSRVLDVLSLRRVVLAFIAIGIGFAIATTSVTPALGTYSHGHECKNTDWNGEYWKVNFKYGLKVKNIETSDNVDPDDIDFDIKYKNFSFTNNSQFVVFKTVEKASWWKQTNWGPWNPGASGSFHVKSYTSYVTFCFEDAPEPEVHIEKYTNGEDPTSGDPNYIAVGDEVLWTYEVTNTGNVPLVDVVVSDDPEGTPSGPSGDNGNGKLDPHETWTYSASGTAQAGPYENSATVTAVSKFDSNASAGDTDTSGYFGSDPSIAIDVDGPDGPVTIGDEFDWVFTVFNTGNVPLDEVVVLEDGEVLCSLGTLAPGADDQCTYTETASEESASSTFTARGVFDDGTEIEQVVEQTIENVVIDINNPPEAGENEEYEADEKDTEGVALFEVDEEDGVLANASDPDEDDLTAVLLVDATNGDLTLNPDGSFSYLPTYVWQSNEEMTYEDSFEYEVQDGRGGTDTATAFITINRNLCVSETVSGGFANLFAEFTLVSFEDGCKLFPLLEVDPADEPTNGEVLFVPPIQSVVGTYTAELEVQGVDVTDGFLTEVVLQYDPLGGTNYGPVPDCDGSSASPVIPPGGDTWCFYDIEFDLNGGLWDITWFLLGQEDPSFRFR